MSRGKDIIYDTAIVDECQDFQALWVSETREHSRRQIWLGDNKQQIFSKAEEDNCIEELKWDPIRQSVAHYLRGRLHAHRGEQEEALKQMNKVKENH